jgi:hypothetical protein
MEAAVGDRIVVAAAKLGGHMQDGEIINVGSHGAPPYLVRWSDDGRETLFFPGPDAHISHHESHEPASPAAAQTAGSGGAPAAPHQHVKNWSVDLYLFEQDAANHGTRSPSYGCPHGVGQPWRDTSRPERCGCTGGRRRGRGRSCSASPRGSATGCCIR